MEKIQSMPPKSLMRYRLEWITGPVCFVLGRYKRRCARLAETHLKPRHKTFSKLPRSVGWRVVAVALSVTITFVKLFATFVTEIFPGLLIFVKYRFWWTWGPCSMVFYFFVLLSNRTVLVTATIHQKELWKILGGAEPVIMLSLYTHIHSVLINSLGGTKFNKRSQSLANTFCCSHLCFFGRWCWCY